MLFSFILLASAAFASPLVIPVKTSPETRSTSGLVTYLCNLPVIRSICPRQTPGSGSVSTPYGAATGASGNGVVRFAVRYATAARWQSPTPVKVWQIPNNNPAALPPMCPQPNVDPGQYSEDCLFMIIHVPVAAIASAITGHSPKLNTLVWIHGGSNYLGSATGAGLDGSNLAVATNSIVVTVQYRLGVLGFLAPGSGNGGANLGVQDVTEALSFLSKALPSFGGDASQITVAGQSSGATMIRALLGAPKAAAFIKNGILQSDTMFYSFLPRSAYTALQSSYFSSLSCASTSQSCLTALPLSTILSAQATLISNAQSIAPAAGIPEPLRPSVDGSFITTSLSGSSYPSGLKPLLLTTVKNDAGLAIGASLPPASPAAWFQPAVSATFGDSRTNTIMQSGFYNPDSFSADDEDDDTRQALELLGTDASWRCSTWSFGRSYVARGAKVWTGVWMLGATYAGNEAVEYCTVDGRVCHQDDIYLTFGTTPNPTAAQSKLTKEIQARWSAFMHTSNPNPPPSSLGLGQWNPTTSSTVHALQLGGGGGEAADGACTPNFWGNSVQYDWQIYGV